MGKLPFYQDVDGILAPGFFCADTWREALKFKPLKGDLILSTFPKCGTTWTQHIVLLLYRNGEPFDAQYFFQHSPFLEMAGVEMVDKMPRPGCIKTHLPYHLTPMSPDAKYIYVARNPKDTSVSLFHHNRNFPGYKFADGKFEDFFEAFAEGQIEWGDYSDHVMGWYQHKDDPNVLFLTYEYMKKDHRGAVIKIAKFLGPQYEKAVQDPKVLDKVVEYSSVAYMKKHSDSSFTDLFSVAPEKMEKDPNISKGLKKALAGLRLQSCDEKREFNFIRKGVVGDWKSLYTPDQSKRIDEKFKEKTEGTDLVEIFRESGSFEYI